MANTVTTSIVVQFTTTTGTSGVLVLEVDDRAVTDGGLNGGKSSFLPGDDVYLLMYKGSNVTIDALLTSLGAIYTGVSVTVQKTEDITFAGETEASLKYPTNALTSYTWLGRNNGNVTLVGDNTLKIPAPATGDYPVGICRVVYNTQGVVQKLVHSDPGFSDYGIVVFVAGHTT